MNTRITAQGTGWVDFEVDGFAATVFSDGTFGWKQPGALPEHVKRAGLALYPPSRGPRRVKLPKLSPRDLVALTQYRENLEGGDPHMAWVTGETMRRLEKRGLIATAYYDYDAFDGPRPDWQRRVFERSHIPTRLGLAVLDAYTQGPRP